MMGVRLIYPTLIEKKFAKQAEAFVEALRKEVVDNYLPAIFRAATQAENDHRNDDASLPGDGGWPSEAQKAARKLRAFADEIGATAEPLANKASYELEQWTNKEINKIEKLLPADMAKAGYNPENLRSNIRQTWSKNYAGLITQVADETVGNISRITYEGLTAGESYKSIEKKILANGPIEGLKKAPFDTAKKRARLIARDQVGKLNGKLVEKRQLQLGIDSYIWRTSMDERVRGNPGGRYPRANPSHWSREGKVYKWSEPPQGGHPGEAILCRCSAEPYIEGVTGSKGEPGAPGNIIQPAMSLAKKIKALENSAVAALNLASGVAEKAVQALVESQQAAANIETIMTEIENIVGTLDELAKKSATTKLSEALKKAEELKKEAEALKMAGNTAKAKADEVLASKYSKPSSKMQAQAALSHVDTIEKSVNGIEEAIGKAKAAKGAAEAKLSAALAKKEAKAAALAEAEIDAAGVILETGKLDALTTAGTFSEIGAAEAQQLSNKLAGSLLKLKPGTTVYSKTEAAKKKADDYIKAVATKKAGEQAATLTVAEKVIPKAGDALDGSGWKIVGKKGGSNPGAIYEDQTGARYIVKVMDEEKIANELLASRLYAAAGVKTSEMAVVEGVVHNGKPVRAIAGKWIDGLEDASLELDLAKTGVGGYIDGAGADMWLANWDAIGLEKDNILKNTAGELIRIDTGAAMKFRAMGTPKPFPSDSVPELETYLNGVNDQITPVLSKYSDDDITRSLEKVAKMDDKTIDGVIDSIKGETNISGKALEEYRVALKGRRDIIKAEWEKRGGPALSGDALPSSPKIKKHDPFKDYKPGDPIPGISPEAAETLVQKWADSGGVTMKNALKANGLEWDKAKVTYPDEVVKDVQAWQKSAEKALNGEGPFPKPLDTVGINKKLADIEEAKKKAEEAANIKQAAGLMSSALSMIQDGEKAISNAKAATTLSEMYKYLGEANDNADKAVADASKASKYGAGSPSVIYAKANAILAAINTVKTSAKFKALEKKAAGAINNAKGAITAAEKKKAGKNTGSPSVLFTQNGKELVSSADGHKIVYAADTNYAKNLTEAGVINAKTGRAFVQDSDEAADHWKNLVSSKIEGPYTKDDAATRARLFDTKQAPKNKAEYILHDYTGASYEDHNNNLRGITVPTEEELQSYKEAADLIRQHTVTEPFVAWRGSDLGYLADIIGAKGQNISDLVGTVYTEHAFMSTTLVHDAAFSSYGNEYTLFRLNVPKGAKAIPARHISKFSSEHELIFPPETRMYISKYTAIDPSDPLSKGGKYKKMLTVEILPE